MNMQYKGNAWRYGDNVDTDVIIPARYLNVSDPMELGRHCMEDIDREFIKGVKQGDIMVAGENFGCGSSREHAPIALKAAGISCVAAKSFARIFFRNSFNMGLPIIECPEAVNAIRKGDEVEVDLMKGIIRSGGAEFSARPVPDFMQELVRLGGLMNYAKTLSKS